MYLLIGCWGENKKHCSRCNILTPAAMFFPFFKEISRSIKKGIPKKFEIFGFLKKHILELSPRLSPTAFSAAPFCVKKLEKHRISYRNPVFLWSVRPIEIFAEIHDFQGFAGLHPLFFCRFRCDGCGFSTRGSILVFDQKRCPLYPCRKID